MCSTPGFAKDLYASSLKQATEINSAVTPATQCLYTSTDNGAQTTTTSITHKHPKQALVSGDSTQAKPSLTGSTALVVPQFQLGRVDAKKFPPRHYDIFFLEIGTWKVGLI